MSSVTPRRAREIARTRKDILEAAARAFVQSGFKAATMQDIAKEAGYTAASLYGYFASKEEIFAELHEMLLGEMREVFALPFPAGLTLRQKLEMLMRHQVEVAERRFETFAMFLLDASQTEGGACSGFTTGFHHRVELYVDFLETHACAEDLGGHTTHDVAVAIVGMGHGFFMEWMRAPSVSRLGDKLETTLDLLFFGLRGSTQPVSRRESAL